MIAKSVHKLNKKITNTRKFLNNNVNKFTLSLKNHLYPDEYTYNWQRFDETSFPAKRLFTVN